MNNDNPLFFVGVDWGSQSHCVCVIDRDNRVVGERSFKHSGEGLLNMGEWIIKVAGSAAGEVAAGIEVTRGPVVESLMACGFSVHSINPKQLDRFRDRFSLAGAKDDRRDAMVLASALRTDRRHFRSLEPQCDDTRTLRTLSRRREELVTERTRHINRMGEQLWVYYPQFRELVGNDTIRPWIIELWQLAPTPDAARRIRVSSVQKILERHKIRRVSAEEALGILRSKKINISPSAASDCVWRIQSIVEHFDLVSRQIRETEVLIKEMLDAIISRQRAENAGTARPSDLEILLSMPGVGPVTAATLVGECYDLIRRCDYRALRCVTGTAPVTKQSGKSKYVMRRRTSSCRLQAAICHWARVAVLHDSVSKAQYRSLRARGLRHSRSLRSVGDRLLRIACVLLKKGELFDKNFKELQKEAA